MIVGGEEGLHIIGESIIENGGANAVADADDKAFVMNAGESFTS